MRCGKGEITVRVRTHVLRPRHPERGETYALTARQAALLVSIALRPTVYLSCAEYQIRTCWFA